MAKRTCDVVVIGGGPGGYVCAIRLGQLKQKVALHREGRGRRRLPQLGLHPVEGAHRRQPHLREGHRHGATMGIMADGVEVDVERDAGLEGGHRQEAHRRRARPVQGQRRRARRRARATLTGPEHASRSQTPKATTETIEATKAIVIATGSSTIEIPTFKFDGKQIIGAKEAVSLREIPKRLLVIGGGVIGLELGMVYQKFGSELTVVEATAAAAPGHRSRLHGGRREEDRQARRQDLQEAPRRSATRSTNDGSLAVKVDVGDGKHETIVTRHASSSPSACARTAKGLGLEEVGVKVDARLRPDRQARAHQRRRHLRHRRRERPPLLAHKATKEGEVVAEVIAGHKAAKDWVADPGGDLHRSRDRHRSGLTEAQAKEKGIEVAVGKFPFAALGRAMAVNETDGFVKIVADKKTHELLGVHIVGPEASDLISEGALALEMAAFLEDVGLTIHPHPTLGEAVMIAAQHALGQAIDILNRPQS